MKTHFTVSIFADKAESGRDVLEEVLVSDGGDGEYLLERSPGLAVGIAAGDKFRRNDDGRYVVTTRGGNVCIQILGQTIREDVVRQMLLRLCWLGGRLDGRTGRVLVFTVPVRVGFDVIERELAWLDENAPEVQWFYGNVYDAKDGVTPLNWW